MQRAWSVTADRKVSVYHRGLEGPVVVLVPSQTQQLSKSRELFHILAQKARDLVTAKRPSLKSKNRAAHLAQPVSIPTCDQQVAPEVSVLGRELPFRPNF